MKKEIADALNRTESAANAASEFYNTQVEIAFLTGRVVQFVFELAKDAGLPARILAQRVSEQLGDRESREPSGTETPVSPLPQTRTKTRRPARKVAVGRRTRKPLSGQRLRFAKAALAAGKSVNWVAKKYKMSWLTANALRKAA